MIVPQVSWSTEDSGAGYHAAIEIDLATQSSIVVCPGCGEACDIWEAMMECLRQEEMTEFEMVTRHVVHGCGQPDAAVFWFWRNDEET